VLNLLSSENQKKPNHINDWAFFILALEAFNNKCFCDKT
jgi:hypothetical protein